ncbi:MAG TPA: hypothetical protein VNN73_00545 [Blastocatellia bacterium]|nr:hypothetical protein [Blastocatellia bacterium]
MQSRKIMTSLLIALFVIASSVARAASFNNPANEDTLSGKYEGVAKSEAMGDIPLTVELKNDNGKLSGKIDTPQGPATITGGTYTDGKITMKFDAGGNEGTITATVQGDKIVGKWELGGQGGAFEMKKVGGAGHAAEKHEDMKPAAADPISGEWDASADAQGMTIPFTLKLKLEGDKVTGSSESAQGTAAISKGTFKDNKLSFSLDTPNGSITMTGMVKDGKIDGEFDFAGQVTGKWGAKKK